MRRPAAALILTSVAIAAPASAHHHDHCRTHACLERTCRARACHRRVARRLARRRPAAVATASWYGPGLYGNATACGQTLAPGSWGVANKSLPCGTTVRLCAARCASAPVIDRGPYVAGRTFDLTPAVRDAVGLGGVGQVRYAIG